MKIHRFIISIDLSPQILTLTDKQLCHQLSTVLHLTRGEEIILCDGELHEARCRIEALSSSQCRLSVLERMANTAECPINGTLYCSLLKKDQFEWVLQKAVEVGIRAIVPIISERTVKLSPPSPDRATQILREAAEQSGRGMVPHLGDLLALEDVFSSCVSKGVATLFFHKQGMDFISWKHQNISPQSINVCIGPEGGWTESEVASAQDSGCAIVSMGATTLRAETAAIVGSYLALH